MKLLNQPIEMLQISYLSNEVSMKLLNQPIEMLQISYLSNEVTQSTNRNVTNILFV